MTVLSLQLIFLTLTFSGCETGKGVLADTQNVLNSVANIISSGRTIADVAK